MAPRAQGLLTFILAVGGGNMVLVASVARENAGTCGECTSNNSTFVRPFPSAYTLARPWVSVCIAAGTSWSLQPRRQRSWLALSPAPWFNFGSRAALRNRRKLARALGIDVRLTDSPTACASMH